MHRIKKVISWFAAAGFVLTLFVSAPTAVKAAAVKGKPMIPVQVAIEPTTAKMKPQDIRPGDVVEFKVTASLMRGADEMSVEISLLDGTELVSGDLKWSGKLTPKEQKQLVISVRAPATGVGRVMAAVSALRNGRVVMAKQTVYTLGSDGFSVKGKPAHGMRKNSKGRDVVEY